MYVEDGKRTYRHVFYHTFLNMVSFECNATYVENVEEFNFQSKKVLKS